MSARAELRSASILPAPDADGLRGEYRLIECDGHLLIAQEDGLALVDTGSPVTLHDTNWLSDFVRMPVVRLLGTDLLRARPFLVDWPGQRVVFDAAPLTAEPVVLDSFLGVPMLELEHGGRLHSALLDTGAQLSYAPPSIVAGGRSHQVRADFMPALGHFEVASAVVGVRIGRVEADLRVGVLPASAVQALGLLGIPEWIVGSELFRDRRVWLDLAAPSAVLVSS